MRKRIELKFDENTNLIAYIWSNPDIKKIGCIQIAHGINEHSLRYESLAKYLNDLGFTVICADHYHQGESCENISDKNIIKNYDFIDSIVKSIKLVREELDFEFEGITCLYAHSMGAIAAQNYLQKYSNDFQKVVLSGTDIGTFKYHFLKFLTFFAYYKKDYQKSSKIVQNLTLDRFCKFFKEESSNNWISANPKNRINYQNDPLCKGIIPDINYYSVANSLLKTYKTKNIKKINQKLEILLISGEDDPVTNFTKSTKKLYKRYKKQNIDTKMKIYQNMRHEVHQEIDINEYYDDLKNFLLKKVVCERSK